MTPFTVTVRRTELIAYQLDAADAADAQARYLADGDEVASSTVETVVESAEACTADEVLG